MFKELVGSGVLCCPDSGEMLEAMEPWLYVSSESENYYPVLGGTPILHCLNDGFLETEIWTVARALAEWPDQGEARAWYFQRYGSIAAASVPDMDTEVRGEGYPGFWNLVDMPHFARELVADPPEALLAATVQRHAAVHELSLGLGLDIGCGQGGMIQHMAELCDRVLGLDHNFYLSCLANRQLPAEEIPIRYLVPERGVRQDFLSKNPVTNALVICGQAEGLPFSDECLDWVNCGHCLDLVEEPGDVLREALRVLKPGGLLTICTPWDVEGEGHFDEMPGILDAACEALECIEGIPWLRFNHKRRFILHEDWIWVGRKH